ncbi:MAG: hypothetical protein WC323_01315 [Patescibacteria group bacterium]|jgi:hypothetical protein
MFKYKIIFFILLFFSLPAIARAQHFGAEYFDDPVNFYFQIGDVDDDGDPEWLKSGGGEVRGELVLGDKDPRMIIADIINIILGFLGIISLIIIISAGFKWMLSSGNEDQANAAKKMLWSGVIGLILVLSSYGIARFLINAIAQTVNSN